MQSLRSLLPIIFHNLATVFFCVLRISLSHNGRRALVLLKLHLRIISGLLAFDFSCVAKFSEQLSAAVLFVFKSCDDDDGKRRIAYYI